MVRNNYDSLTLRLQDNLDNFERYSERPKEAVFFSDLVCNMLFLDSKILYQQFITKLPG